MPERRCVNCDGSMESRRTHAVYCSRTCKTRASDARRTADGRAQTRDRARYEHEAVQRRTYARVYFREHRERVRELMWRRRARRAGARIFEFSARDWARLVARFLGRCAYCGERAQVQPDHVIPLSRGGVHGIGNILPACTSCNVRKRARFVAEWRHAS